MQETLQEVRFRKGSHHTARFAKLIPDYLVISVTDTNPDVMFLVHKNISRYSKLHSHYGHWGLSLTLTLPGCSPVNIVNIHGPFTPAERAGLDTWIDSHRNIGMIMGDFNDPIWSTRRVPTRTWQRRLREDTLVDPPPPVRGRR